MDKRVVPRFKKLVQNARYVQNEAYKSKTKGPELSPLFTLLLPRSDLKFSFPAAIYFIAY